jgi:hypothetical protein
MFLYLHGKIRKPIDFLGRVLYFYFFTKSDGLEHISAITKEGAPYEGVRRTAYGAVPDHGSDGVVGLPADFVIGRKPLSEEHNEQRGKKG